MVEIQLNSYSSNKGVRVYFYSLAECNFFFNSSYMKGYFLNKNMLKLLFLSIITAIYYFSVLLFSIFS